VLFGSDALLYPKICPFDPSLKRGSSSKSTGPSPRAEEHKWARRCANCRLLLVLAKPSRELDPVLHDLHGFFIGEGWGRCSSRITDGERVATRSMRGVEG